MATTKDGFKIGFGAVFGVFCAGLLLLIGWHVYLDVARELEMREQRRALSDSISAQAVVNDTPHIVTIGEPDSSNEDAVVPANEKSYAQRTAEREAREAAEFEARRLVVREEMQQQARRLKEEDDRRAKLWREHREREAEQRRDAERRVEEQRAVEEARQHAAENAKFRRWKSSIGTSIEAKLVSYSAGVVTLEARNGKGIKVAVDKLSRADQAYIAKWRRLRTRD